jgi:hypothetical protein
MQQQQQQRHHANAVLAKEGFENASSSFSQREPETCFIGRRDLKGA